MLRFIFVFQLLLLSSPYTVVTTIVFVSRHHHRLYTGTLTHSSHQRTYPMMRKGIISFVCFGVCVFFVFCFGGGATAVVGAVFLPVHFCFAKNSDCDLFVRHFSIEL